MAFVEDKDKLRNRIQIVGYLKETSLKVSRDEKTREEVISGTITLIAKDGMEFRLYNYARRYKKLKQGQTAPEPNPAYDKLMTLTADRATSLAKVMSMDPNATFESCKDNLTKVFCAGELNERFFVGRDKEVHETVELRPIVIQKAEEKFFSPKAVFEVDVYVDGIYPEQNSETKEETGRYILKGTMLRYDGTAICINFVTNGNPEVNNAVANFAVGETAFIKGNLVHLENKKVIDTSKGGKTFGEAKEMTVTEFVNERIITGGDVMTRAEGEVRTYTHEGIKGGKAARESAKEEAKENPGKQPDSSKTQKPVAASSSQNSTTFGSGSELNDFDGLDF